MHAQEGKRVDRDTEVTPFCNAKKQRLSDGKLVFASRNAIRFRAVRSDERDAFEHCKLRCDATSDAREASRRSREFSRVLDFSRTKLFQ
jgi:hypothetical protein